MTQAEGRSNTPDNSGQIEATRAELAFDIFNLEQQLEIAREALALFEAVHGPAVDNGQRDN